MRKTDTHEIETHQREIRIARTLVDFQNVLHGGYERAILLGRDNPLLLAVRLKFVFFKTRPIVLSLAASTILSSTTFSSNSRNVHRTCPAGADEQASAISPKPNFPNSEK